MIGGVPVATILQYLVYGLQLGSVYALLALGYTMVYGIVGMINFAHGDFLMIGALGTYFIAQLFSSYQIDGTFPMLIVGIIILIAMLGTGGIAVATEAIAYRPLRNKPRMIALITAVGVSMFLENFPRALPFIGPNPRSFPTLFTPKTFNVLGASITSTQIIMIILAAVTMMALYFMVNGTKIGGQMRAVSMDKDAASLMGINVNRVISITFFVGGALPQCLVFAMPVPILRLMCIWVPGWAICHLSQPFWVVSVILGGPCWGALSLGSPKYLLPL